MQVSKHYAKPTEVTLKVTADEAQLQAAKQTVLQRLGRDRVKLAGFRAGKAPLNLIEKQVDPTLLQSEFLDEIINRIYPEAVQQADVRPVAQPAISVTKFVPFTTLEFEATVETIGEIKLPDYTKIKQAKKPVSVSQKEVDDVIDQLKIRAADKQDVTRAAKDGDQVMIDFAGTDAKTQEPVNGADGQDYPLLLGSDSFIPGFEDNLIGLKTGAEKTFTLKFPKDYGVKAMQNRSVKFNVTVKKVQAVVTPKLDDAFAAKVGPFKTMAELKTDIKKQLMAEKQNEADRTYENELIEQIAKGATVDIPEALVDEELDRLEDQEKQNVVYRGQTWQERLDEEQVTAEAHRERNREAARARVKAGLVLAEVAQREKLHVTPEELEIRMQLLKGQYTDPAMQAELDKPEARREIGSRMVTEKTIAKLVGYASKQ